MYMLFMVLLLPHCGWAFSTTTPWTDEIYSTVAPVNHSCALREGTSFTLLRDFFPSMRFSNSDYRTLLNRIQNRFPCLSRQYRDITVNDSGIFEQVFTNKDDFLNSRTSYDFYSSNQFVSFYYYYQWFTQHYNFGDYSQYHYNNIYQSVMKMSLLHGVNKALEFSPPGTFILVETSGLMTDYNNLTLLNDVYRLIQEKQSQVFFLVYEDIGGANAGNLAERVFREIASQSFGQYLKITEPNKEQVIRSLDLLLEKPLNSSVRILNVSLNISGDHREVVNVTSLTFLLITTNGNISLALTDPSGNKKNFEKIVSYAYGSIYLLKNPASGSWFLDIFGNGFTSVNILGFRGLETKGNCSNSECHPNATCEEFGGYNECTCKEGFAGNGFLCDDINECTDYSLNCPSCVNSVGSYNCTCYQGYTFILESGCVDIDECLIEDLNKCHPLAICINTYKGYTCACPYGYFGNGNNCVMNECQHGKPCGPNLDCNKNNATLYSCLDPCFNYTVLDQQWRSTSNRGYDYNSDYISGGWYRFQGANGQHMPNYCVPSHSCGVKIPIWLNGSHPTPEEGITERTVCGSFGDYCCLWYYNISVRACSDGFYVYKLKPVPTYSMAYCVESSMNCSGTSCAPDEYCTNIKGDLQCQCNASRSGASLITSDPANLPSPELICGFNQIKLSFGKCLLENLGYNTSVHLRDSSCISFIERRDKSYVSLYAVPTNGNCGAQIQANQTHLTYVNAVYLLMNSSGANVLVPFYCSYPRENLLQLGVNMFIAYANLTYSGNRTYSAQMGLFQTANYSNLYEGPEGWVNPTDRLYVGINVEKTNESHIVLVMHHCYATPTQESWDPIKFYFIQNTCPAINDSSLFVMENGESLQGRFSLLLFKFIGGFTKVYIHCQVRLCDTTLETCKPMCSGVGNYSADNRNATQNLTLGPVLRKDQIYSTVVPANHTCAVQEGTSFTLLRDYMTAQVFENYGYRRLLNRVQNRFPCLSRQYRDIRVNNSDIFQQVFTNKDDFLNSRTSYDYYTSDLYNLFYYYYQWFYYYNFGSQYHYNNNYLNAVKMSLLDGVKNALEVSPAGTFILVETSGLMTDYNNLTLLNNVYRLIQEKQSQVFFLVYKDIGGASVGNLTERVFREIASQSFGQYLNIPWTSREQVLSGLELLLVKPLNSSVRILNVSLTISGDHREVFNVTSLTFLLITTNGNISLALTDPSGKNENFEKIVSYAYGSFYLLKNPASGRWLMDIFGSGYISVNILGFRGNCSNSECHPNATCEEFGGYNECTCKEGFAGNGFQCDDINECTDYSLNCPSCVNSVGSYNCTCYQGYTFILESGCVDIDECLSEDLNKCHPLAICINTYGGYRCACPDGYFGDGYNCVMNECQHGEPCGPDLDCNKNNATLYSCLDPCFNYTVLDQQWRSTSNRVYGYNYEVISEGWYRFQGTNGQRMPNYCIPSYSCGVEFPIWLNGSHPTPEEGITERTVCGSWRNYCCLWYYNISVRACSDGFYVYKLMPVPIYSMAYCVESSMNCSAASCAPDEYCTNIKGDLQCQCNASRSGASLITSDPANLPSPELICGLNQVKLSFGKCQLENLGYNTSVHLRDSSCISFIERRDKSYVSLYAVPTNGNCGAQIQANQTHLTYVNDVYFLMNSSRTIVVVPFYCSYPRSTENLLQLGVNMFIAYANLTYSGNRTYSAQMGLFQTANYSNLYEDPEGWVNPTDRLYVGINVEKTNESHIVLVMHHCYATPTQESWDPIKFYFIQNTCPAINGSSLFVMENGESLQGRFSLLLFKFIGGFAKVYIHCQVRLCDTTLETCKPMCSGVGNYSADNRNATQNLTLGPVLRKDEIYSTVVPANHTCAVQEGTSFTLLRDYITALVFDNYGYRRLLNRVQNRFPCLSRQYIDIRVNNSDIFQQVFTNKDDFLNSRTSYDYYTSDQFYLIYYYYQWFYHYNFGSQYHYNNNYLNNYLNAVKMSLLDGVKKALEVSPAGTFILVETSGLMSDYDNLTLLNDVYRLIQEKQSQVFFLVYKDIGGASVGNLAESVFREIASQSFGQYLNIPWTSREQVIRSLDVLLAKPFNSSVRILNVSLTISGDHREVFNVTSLTFLLITTNGNISLALTDPSGNNENFENTVSYAYGSFYLLKNPASGPWFIDVFGSGYISVNILGFGGNCSNSECHPNATCEEFGGYNECTCKEGFAGNGFQCDDINECTDYSLYCPSCVNSVGSYNCTCYQGYTFILEYGCVDIDECLSEDLNKCHPLAICINTYLGYSCACPDGYFGDGYNCVMNECQHREPCGPDLDCNKNNATLYSCLDPCFNYTVLDQQWRSTSNRVYRYNFDFISEGWYRFQGTNGQRMPNYCIPSYSCGVEFPIWLNGSHPTPEEGITERTVCGSWRNYCCLWYYNISVRACSGGFYVYKLKPVPIIYMAYCVESSMNCSGTVCALDEYCTNITEDFQCQCNPSSLVASLKTSDPANLPSPELICGLNQIKLSFGKCLLENLGYNTSVHLRDSSCISFIERRDKSYVSLYAVPRNGICGAQIQAYSTYVNYSNELFFSTKSDGVNESLELSRNFSCFFPINMEVVLWLTESFVSSANITVGENATYLAKMGFFRDAEYTRLYQAPSVWSNTESKLYIGIVIEKPQSYIYVPYLKSCYATPSAEIWDPIKIYIIINNCLKLNESTYRITQSELFYQGLISLPMFEYIASYDKLYMHCQIRLCNTISETCNPMCNKTSAVDDGMIAQYLTLGPVILRGKNLSLFLQQ
ncbi:uncharacterized protein LOC108701890 isoform X1 [Xenopus laevis]|uniref:Uncharacterized protein LOC108701890 isoform X1 n=1 Tax=Xenopus laevis TaxID=8355 RepID=A0A8J1LTC6_XENLA|nr:uncharacterized protein LOC108701890 isoform X1 [Xenopus laevis]